MVWATHNTETILYVVRVQFPLAHVNTKVERRFSACGKTVTVSRTRLTEASINNFQIATDEPKTFDSLPHYVPITPSFKKLGQSANEIYYLWFRVEKFGKGWSWKSRHEQKVEVQKKKSNSRKKKELHKETEKWRTDK